jgi:hypothetical protein
MVDHVKHTLLAPSVRAVVSATILQVHFHVNRWFAIGRWLCMQMPRHNLFSTNQSTRVLHRCAHSSSETVLHADQLLFILAAV